MLTYHKATVATLIALCAACANAEGGRIQFCDADGELADDVFFDMASGELVMADMIFGDMLECSGEAVCFSQERKSFVLSHPADGQLRRRNEFDWGYLEWQFEPATGDLVLVLDNQATKHLSSWSSCESVSAQQA